ncbi:hypothetical protein [Pedobacter nutrimenti]|uniref:Transcriptional regulator n=1 Tax=Pedobacter nutrimenti TaxID=1241337 RepID=A0A318UAY0_9SPHI|nr:hypothetical protein [Pedobacter nutrimenti]PYF70619.1 transcriptional regulator [Pedobacter nutrimenti]
MYKLLEEIRDCKVCEIYPELEANPIVSASSKSKIVIIGQARGRIVHQTGIKETAAEINSPEHFLAKILQELSRKDIVKSVKGHKVDFIWMVLR